MLDKNVGYQVFRRKTADNFMVFDLQNWTTARNARCLAKKAEHGSLCNRLKLYEWNSYIHTLNSGDAERCIGVTPGVIYGLDGNCDAIEAAPRGASWYM